MTPPEAMHPECAAEFAHQAERLHALEDHRKRQNGSLGRIEERLNKQGWIMAGILGGVVIQLAMTLLKAGCRLP